MQIKGLTGVTAAVADAVACVCGCRTRSNGNSAKENNISSCGWPLNHEELIISTEAWFLQQTKKLYTFISWNFITNRRTSLLLEIYEEGKSVCAFVYLRILLFKMESCV
ncbi:hypothetical protein YC2023_107347 [Brassica napus]